MLQAFSLGGNAWKIDARTRAEWPILLDPAMMAARTASGLGVAYGSILAHNTGGSRGSGGLRLRFMRLARTFLAL